MSNLKRALEAPSSTLRYGVDRCGIDDVAMSENATVRFGGQRLHALFKASPCQASAISEPAAWHALSRCATRLSGCWRRRESPRVYPSRAQAFHHVTTQVRCRWFGGTPAPTAGTAPL